MGIGKSMWQKTEGGSRGKRGHSNMEHWETTGNVKMAARKARRFQDRRSVEEEMDELLKQFPGMSHEALQAIMRESQE